MCGDACCCCSGRSDGGETKQTSSRDESSDSGKGMSGKGDFAGEKRKRKEKRREEKAKDGNANLHVQGDDIFHHRTALACSVKTIHLLRRQLIAGYPCPVESLISCPSNANLCCQDAAMVMVTTEFDVVGKKAIC